MLTRMTVVAAQPSVPSPGTWDAKEAQDVSRNALQQMRVYVKRYASLYSFKCTSSTMMQYLMLPAYDCLEEMHLQESREIFVLCFGGLQQISTGCLIGQALTQAIRVAAERKGIVLPAQILIPPRQNLTRLLENIYSNYPGYDISSDSQWSRLDSFMKSISDLSLEDIANTSR